MKKFSRHQMKLLCQDLELFLSRETEVRGFVRPNNAWDEPTIMVRSFRSAALKRCLGQRLAVIAHAAVGHADSVAAANDNDVANNAMARAQILLNLADMILTGEDILPLPVKVARFVVRQLMEVATACDLGFHDMRAHDAALVFAASVVLALDSGLTVSAGDIIGAPDDYDAA